MRIQDLYHHYYSKLFHDSKFARALVSASFDAFKKAPEIITRLHNHYQVDPPPEGKKTEGLSPEDACKRYLLRNGIVCIRGDEKRTETLEFASVIHSRFYARLTYPGRLDDTQFGKISSQGIDFWLRFVLQQLDPRTLRQTDSAGKPNFPLEQRFQGNFFEPLLEASRPRTISQTRSR